MQQINDSSSIEEVLYYIVSTYGKEIYKDKQRLSNLISDLYTGDERLKRVYKRAILDDNLSVKIYNLLPMSDNKRGIYYNQLIHAFSTTNFYTVDISIQIIQNLAQGVNCDITNYLLNTNTTTTKKKKKYNLYTFILGITFISIIIAFILSKGNEHLQNGNEIHGHMPIDSIKIPKDTTINITIKMNDSIVVSRNIGNQSNVKKKGTKIATTKMVDLGLSVNWAGWNIGASAPEEYGGLYGWGDPTGQMKSEDPSDYPGGWMSHIDTITQISGTKYDIAYIMWGENWRLPTNKERDELMEKCKWEKITYKGIKGMKITGPNHNCIFLPMSGGRIGNEISQRGEYGTYWTGTIREYSGFPYIFNFGNSTWGNVRYFQSTGHSVRAVTDKNHTINNN